MHSNIIVFPRTYTKLILLTPFNETFRGLPATHSIVPRLWNILYVSSLSNWQQIIFLQNTLRSFHFSDTVSWKVSINSYMSGEQCWFVDELIRFHFLPSISEERFTALEIQDLLFLYSEYSKRRSSIAKRRFGYQYHQQ